MRSIEVLLYNPSILVVRAPPDDLVVVPGKKDALALRQRVWLGDVGLFPSSLRLLGLELTLEGACFLRHDPRSREEPVLVSEGLLHLHQIPC